MKFDWIDVTEYELTWEDGLFRMVESNGDIVVWGESISKCIDELYSSSVALALQEQEIKELENGNV